MFLHADLLASIKRRRSSRS